MTAETNRPGYVFHCEFEGCRERGLKLVPVLIRIGVRRHFWRCEIHR